MHFVIGDTHGNYDLMLGLLRSADLIDDERNRTNDVKIVHVGDLTNNVRSSVQDDIACLALAHRLIDVYILGNHEAPALGLGGFGGYHPSPEITQVLNQFDRMGKLVPSYCIGNTLITHAGVAKRLNDNRFVEDELTHASEMDAYLNFLWQNRGRDHKIFNQVGPNRGGWSREGGILWSDWSEGKTKAFNQIVGHTPQDSPQRREFVSRGTWVQHIDVGGKRGRQLYGVFVDDNGDVKEGVLHVG